MHLEKNALQKVQTYCNLVNHIIISIVAVYMSSFCYHWGNRPIAWHVWLCTLGYQLLMAEAIMSFYSQNIWSQLHSRKIKRNIHWILQVIGSTAALTGIIIKISTQEGAHFHTKHSVVGLIAGIFTLMSMFNGVSSLWSVELKKYVKPSYIKCIHNLNGMTAFILGMVAIFFGLDKVFLRAWIRDDVRIGLQIMVISSIMLSLIGALRSVVNQVKTIIGG